MYRPQITIETATKDPALLVAKIATQCKFQYPKDYDLAKANALCKKLYITGHHSPLEFATACLRITNVSRAFMAQIRTHRHFSFMCSSQHFQNYSTYPMVETGLADLDRIANYLGQEYHAYIQQGRAPEDVRMILPNASSVNMYMIGNARAWADMLRKRICTTNILEMQTFAVEALDKLKDWFPTVFNLVDAPCKDAYEGRCREGGCAYAYIKAD